MSVRIIKKYLMKIIVGIKNDWHEAGEIQRRINERKREYEVKNCAPFYRHY